MPFLIDGHNLIAHLPDIELDDPDDEAKLVIKLRGFAARTRKKCIVIFDEGLPGGTSSLTTHSVLVVFASSKRTNADRIIMERISDIRDAPNWTVVSSDNEVLDAATIAGMRPMRCISFAEMLTRPRDPKPHPGINENVMVSAKEVEEWMQVFGISDKDELGDAVDSIDTTPAQPKPKQSSQPKHKPKDRVNKEQEKPKTPQQSPEYRSRRRNEVEQWLDIFGDEPAPEPSDKARPITPRNPTPKPQQDNTEQGLHVDARMGDSDNVYVSDNSVDAWMELFGEADKTIEPTDPAPQRSDPKKQGRYKNQHGKREPNVHKRMATSDEVYLNDGEVDAWMELFGAEDEDDE